MIEMPIIILKLNSITDEGVFEDDLFCIKR